MHGTAWARWLWSRDVGRAGFAAAALPSFHVFWALLLASVLAERGGRCRWLGRWWPAVMSAACILNGAHAVADVAAAWLIWPVVSRLVVRRGSGASASGEETAREQTKQHAGAEAGEAVGKR